MNQLKTTMLMAALMGLFLFFGQLLGGQQGLVIAFVLAAGLNFFSYFYSDKIVLKMYKAQEVTENEQPRLYRMVAGLAQKTRMPMPRVYIIPNPTPNAFATGRNPKHAVVAATAGIMNLLSDEELEAVMAHELGHVQNRDILISSVVATIAGAIAMLASMVRWAAIFGHVGGRGGQQGNIFGALALAIVAPIMALVIQMAVSRAREFEADKTGAEVCGNPLALARALQKIHGGVQRRPMEITPGREANAHMFIANPFRGKGMVSMLSTHPPMEERVARLEAMVYGRTRP
jgi:heat shock protein HtpX